MGTLTRPFQSTSPTSAARLRLGGAVVALACLAIAAGCNRRGSVLSPEIIRAAGTHTFQAPVDKVFVATEGALRGEGYEIALSLPEKGLIKTSPKLVTVLQREHEVIRVTRQYLVTVRAVGDATEVSAEPRMFEGAEELSKDDAVWRIEAPADGERAQWKRLFRDIQEAL